MGEVNAQAMIMAIKLPHEVTNKGIKAAKTGVNGKVSMARTTAKGAND
jgi:hypothetical protein